MNGLRELECNFKFRVASEFPMQMLVEKELSVNLLGNRVTQVGTTISDDEKWETASGELGNPASRFPRYCLYWL